MPMGRCSFVSCEVVDLGSARLPTRPVDLLLWERVQARPGASEVLTGLRWARGVLFKVSLVQLGHECHLTPELAHAVGMNELN